MHFVPLHPSWPTFCWQISYVMLRLQWKWQKSIWRKKECQCCRYRECQCMIIKNVHRISAYVSLRELSYNYKRRGCFSAVLPLLPLTRRSGRCYLVKI
jgi:hypothetical protein